MESRRRGLSNSGDKIYSLPTILEADPLESSTNKNFPWDEGRENINYVDFGRKQGEYSVQNSYLHDRSMSLPVIDYDSRRDNNINNNNTIRRSSTSSVDQVFKCPYQDCEKTFTRFYNLKSHLRTHTGGNFLLIIRTSFCL
jgi:uncharacterized Zn-finger protein